MVSLWYGVTDSPNGDKCNRGFWEESWSSSTFDPSHLWLRSSLLQQHHHPTHDPQYLQSVKGSCWYSKNGPPKTMMVLREDVMRELEYNMNINNLVVPMGHHHQQHHHQSWVYPPFVFGTNDISGEVNGGSCRRPLPIGAAPLVNEGERTFGGRPIPPRRKKGKRSSRRMRLGLKELERDTLQSSGREQEICDHRRDSNSWAITIEGKTLTVGGSYYPDGVTNQGFDCVNNNCGKGNYDELRMVEEACGRRGVGALSGTGPGNSGGGGVGDGKGGGRVERGGGGRRRGTATAAAGVSGCVQVPSSGGTRGCLPSAPPHPPLSPPHHHHHPTPPPPPSPSCDHQRHHPLPRTLWRLLTCWVVREKMADWDVDLASPTYCAACAVMDTRAEKCCSSAWDTAEAWWGSFVCPSWWGCGGAEVIKETPKPSSTLPPKPPVGPSPEFKGSKPPPPPPPPPPRSSTPSVFGLPLNLLSKLESPKKHSSAPSFAQHEPVLDVPQCKPSKANLFVPKWVNSRSQKSSMLKWKKKKKRKKANVSSVSVPTVSSSSFCSSSPTGYPRVKKTRLKLPAKLTCKRKLSDRNISCDFSTTTLKDVTSKIKRPRVTFTHKALPYSRLKTRLKTRLKMLKGFVTDQIYR